MVALAETVSVKTALVGVPATVALTVTVAPTFPALSLGALAIPLLPVTTDAVSAPPANVADPDVTANVTDAPANGTAGTSLSDTATTNSAGNACPTNTA
jgi:hypothetical protein